MPRRDSRCWRSKRAVGIFRVAVRKCGGSAGQSLCSRKGERLDGGSTASARYESSRRRCCLAPQLGPSWTSSERTFEQASRHRLKIDRSSGAVHFSQVAVTPPSSRWENETAGAHV